MSVPAVAPAVSADLLGALPSRLAKRVAALSEESSSWEIVAAGDAVTITIGTETVTLPAAGAFTADAVVCSCLLAPRCAHVGAVVTVAPIAEADSAAIEEGAFEEGEGEAPADEGVGEAVSPASVSHLSDLERRAVEQAWLAVAEILARGARYAGPDSYAALLSSLHSLRVAGLPAAATPLTAVTEQIRRLRSGQTTFSRPELTTATARSLVALHRLRHADAAGAVEDERGSARRKYAPIGSLSLAPVVCEPVLTSSGYAGVVLTFADASGRLWTVQRLLPILPGDEPIAMVRSAYRQSSGFHGLSADVASMARKRLLLGNATGSSDGRLGAGQKVQATTGRVVEASDAWAALPEYSEGAAPGLYRLSGMLSWAPGQGWIDDLEVVLSAPAAALAAWTGVMLAARSPEPTAAVVRIREVGEEPELVAYAPGIPMGDSVGGRIFCGLDGVEPSWFPARTDEGVRIDEVDIDWPLPPPPTAYAYLERWLSRLVADGRPALIATDAPARDARLLRTNAAPLAADLIDGVVAGARDGQTRFDGTWAYDDAPLASSALRLAAYLVAD